MSNGDCPVGASNTASIDYLKTEVADMGSRLRRTEIDMATLKTRMGGYAAAGAFIASVLVQVIFKLMG